jgi:hypothetical protein
MGVAAGKMRIKLRAETAIDTEVNLCMTDGAYFRQARLNVSLPRVWIAKLPKTCWTPGIRLVPIPKA